MAPAAYHPSPRATLPRRSSGAPSSWWPCASESRLCRSGSGRRSGTPTSRMVRPCLCTLRSSSTRHSLRASVTPLLPSALCTSADAPLVTGERQLFSLCRGLVAGEGQQGLRVLLCDEPTSNVDLGSDNLVHSALLALRCTVCMAPCFNTCRLNSVSNSRRSTYSHAYTFTARSS